MLETRIIEAAALQDVAAWERANKAKLLTAEILDGGQARAQVLPVAEVDWWINVWNCKGDLMIGDTDAGDLFHLDPEALAALVDQVIYEDHESGINVSGQYYPLSDESRAAFARLMETAQLKPRLVGSVRVGIKGDTDPAEVKDTVKRILADVYKSGAWLVEKDNAQGQE